MGIKKILIIRFSSIGDIVLTTPVIRCLNQQLQDCEIHYLTKPAFQTILSHNPYIHHLFFLDQSLHKTIQTIKNEQYDIIIDLHKNLRTYTIATLTGIKTIRFNKLNIEKWLMVNFKINRLPQQHLVDRYFESLHSLGIVNDHKGLDFFVDESNCLDLPFGKAPYIAVAVGAKHFTKSIPLEKLLAIIRKLQLPVVLLGDQNDYKKALLIEAHFKNRVKNYCGKLNLQQSAYLIQQAKALLTGDTGLMHIAAAFNKPIFSVWGNTTPQFGMYPYLFKNNKHFNLNELHIYENKDLPCRPCSKIGYNACPKQHFKCMNELDITGLIKDMNNLP